MINYNHTDKKTKKKYLKNKQITHNPFDPTITSKSKDGERERERKEDQTNKKILPTENLARFDDTMMRPLERERKLE